MATVRHALAARPAGAGPFHRAAAAVRLVWSAFVDARRMAIRHEALSHMSPKDLARHGLVRTDLPRAVVGR